MDERSRKLGWKGPLIVVALLALPVLGGLGVHFYLDAVLNRYQQEFDAFRADFPTDISPRPAILSPEEPGNVWELYLPAFSRIDALDDNVDNFDAHGIVGQTPRLIGEAGASLEQCRRATRRSLRTWSGAPPTISPNKAIRALDSKGVLLWRDGRDAEAVEWLLVSLTVAYDWAALTGDWEVMTNAESSAVEDFGDLLSDHSLSAAQLEDLGSRLKLLRSRRMSMRVWIRARYQFRVISVLEADVWVYPNDDSSGIALSEVVNWKDLYSQRVAKARILNSLRSCRRELDALSWDSGTIPPTQSIVDSYNGRFVHSWVKDFTDAVVHQAGLNYLDYVIALVDCARYQAVHGRLPESWKDVGISGPLTTHLVLEEDRVVAPITFQSWPLARRK